MKSLPTSYTAARKWGIILLLALASLGAALLSMSFGSTQVPFSEILTALMGGETQAYNIVVYARLPRTLAALLCGSALAVGGVIIQGVLGNPLAGPNIIGVNAGAGLGAVLCAALIPTSMTAVPVAAFLGALGACMLVYTLARRTGASRITLVLAGVAISSMLSAAIDAVSILFPEAALGAGSFMVGRLSGVTVAALKVPALLSLLAGAGVPPLGVSLGLWCNAALLWRGVSRSVPLRLSRRSLAVQGLGTLMTFAAAWGVVHGLDGHSAVAQLACAVPAGAAVYGVCVAVGDKGLFACLKRSHTRGV